MAHEYMVGAVDRVKLVVIRNFKGVRVTTRLGTTDVPNHIKDGS